MNETELSSLNGRVLALSMTISSIIQTLPAMAGAQAALHLKIAQEEIRLMDEEDEVPLAEIQARDSILDSYVDLLGAVAKQRG